MRISALLPPVPGLPAPLKAVCVVHFAELLEAIRAVTDAPDTYTFWDYQGGAWQKNNGIRIDHLLLSPEAADHFADAAIEKHVRAWEKPSDHVPVAVELAL